MKNIGLAAGATILASSAQANPFDNAEVKKLNPKQQEFMLRYGKWMDDFTEVVRLQKVDPYNLEDAIFSAANYLAANGAAEGNIEKAVFAYNHADWYVKEVLDYANTFASMGTIPVNADGFVWPVPFTKELTSTFGTRSDPINGNGAFHNGLDIAGPGINGKPVVAFATGKVIQSGSIGGYGNAVIISHSNGLESLYGHLSSISIKTGQEVKAGEQVGAIGSTGRSTGPHLHFTIKKDGTAIDPMTLLK